MNSRLSLLRTRRQAPRTLPASFSEADAELATTLDALDDADNYRRWIFDLIKPHLGASVLEVGAGHGTFTELLASGRRVVATDLSQRCAAILRDRFAGDPDVQVLQADIVGAGVAGPFDAAVLVNVLEHVEDDNALLSELTTVLVPGGRIVLWVPAFGRLYSNFDRMVGHYRRYEIPGLRTQLTSAGYHVTDVRYVNTIGALAWWLVACQMGRTPTGRTGVRLFDRYFVPFLRWAEHGHRPPFGQSIFAVATRPS